MAADFSWRCNILDCRETILQQAVVTTCSHILCLPCAEKTGLSAPTNDGIRQCPACGVRLMNQDDAVITQLDPSEDYKTSVLSGLTPTIIMECAGRGLSFYNYQVNQEITYQSHLASNLRKKHNNINQQLDTIIAQANLQIKKLQDALSESDRKYADLENKNLDLRNAFKDKNKAFQDMQKQYQELKGEKMRFQARDAASEVAEQVSQGPLAGRFSSKSHAVYSRGVGGVSGEFQGARGLYNRPRSGSSESADGLRAQRAGAPQAWQHTRQPSRGYTSQSLPMFSTPSSHRTRLPMGINQNQSSFGVDGITGVSRQALNTIDPNNVGAPPLSGYGMSAGVKMGKTRSLNRTAPRVSRNSLSQEFVR
ncbi:hypothetical protein FKW77_004042 [Venturia effusa]|uniref:RING-type domain-containing protein n=1 Tax=Venturia effusa TaxID=50376 RepID=A0A517LF93_9PEZI|nr:hypothetical protein FKW77_004042 [Venturia effusa]